VMNYKSSAMSRKILLSCGLLSSLYYIFINIYVPMQYPGYSIVSQTVSELSAIDAPTKPLWVLLVSFYSLLVIAFGWGLLLSSANNRPLRVVATLMLMFGISGFFWPPMHQREILAANGGTLTDTLHIVFAVATVLFMLLIIAFGAAAFGKGFRYYSIATIIVLLVFGTLTGIAGPDISKNLPTPLAGIWERINIGVYMLWTMVLAMVVLRKSSSSSSFIRAVSKDQPLVKTEDEKRSRPKLEHGL
jgi:Protein of unknown function (DUF998)